LNGRKSILHPSESPGGDSDDWDDYLTTVIHPSSKPHAGLALAFEWRTGEGTLLIMINLFIPIRIIACTQIHPAGD